MLRWDTKGDIRVELSHRRVYLWNGEEGAAKLWHLMAPRTLDAQERAEKDRLEFEQRSGGHRPGADRGDGLRTAFHRAWLP